MDQSTKTERAQRAPAKPWFLKSRAWHNYVGMFIAPSLVFFALTGVAQTFNLHEDHVGYTAPGPIAVAASLHKDQVLPEPETASHDEPAEPNHVHPAPSYTPGQLALKLYVTLVAVGLIASTVLGVVMTLQNRLRRRASLALLALGTLAPVLIALFARG
jgi:hypothetical protein